MESLSMLETFLNGADGPTAVFLAESNFQPGMGALVATAVVGILIGLFGFKLMKLLAAFCGFTLGAVIGLIIATVAGVSGVPFLLIVFGCAIALAVLLIFLRRVGAFFIALIYVSGALLSLFPLKSLVMIIIALAVSLVIAILAAIFVDPLVIIATALCGGISAGTAIAAMPGLEEITWISYVASAVLVILGMIVQFMMQSRKIGKKEKVYSDKIKQQDSMESEVEKARMILDDDDDVSEESDESGDDEIKIENIDLDEEIKE